MAVVLLMAGTAAAQAPDALDEVTLHLKWKHQFQFAGYYAAQQQGYYREAGLKVNIVPAGPESGPSTSVLSGEAEFGVWDSELLRQRVSGRPYVVLAVIFQHAPDVVVSRRDRGIRMPSDLVGRTVMVTPSQGEATFRAMLIHEGLRPEDVDIIPYSWRIADVAEGLVDASVNYITNEPDQLRRMGVEPAVMRPLDYGIDFYGDCLFTTERQIARYPNRVKAFRQASLKGWQYAMDHVEEMITYILALPGVRERGFDADHLRYEAGQMRDLIVPDLVEIGHMNPGRWRHIADTYAEVGLLVPDVPLDGFLYDPDPAPDYRWYYIALGALAGVLLVTAAAFAWNRQLRGAVARRTRELAESEARFRQLADATWEAIVVHDQGEVLEVNQQFLDLFQYTWEEVLGPGSVPRFTTSDSSSGLLELIQKGGLGPYRATGRRKDGAEFPMEVRVRLMDYHGRQVRVAAIRDTTEQDRIAAELRDQIQLVKQIVDSAEQGIVVHDRGLRCEVWNPFMERFSGVPASQVVGRRVVDVFPFLEDHDVTGRLQRGLAGETLPPMDIRVAREDGTVGWASETTGPLRNERGDVTGVIVMVSDITARKAAEETRLALEEQLRQAQKMEAVGQLAGGVAHDFNNLLQAILGYGDMALEDAAGNDAAVASIQEMLAAGNRAKVLVNQLLAFSRQQVLQMENVDLNMVVKDMMRMLRRVLGEHLNLEVRAGHGLEPVRADPGQLGQIILNLCVNARDAMGEGGSLTIDTAAASLDDAFCRNLSWALPGDYIRLSVTDTGTGMDEETLANAFEPFFTTKEVGAGSGLGLSTVYGLVKQHGGLIDVHSEPGKGTRFDIYLPVSPGATDVPAQASMGPVAGGTETLLLAEDDNAVRLLTRKILELAGYTVRTAADGEEAVGIFQADPDAFDMALLDVMMPKRSGRAAAEAITAIRPGTPILFTSGYSMEYIHTNFVLDPGVDLIRKPCDRDELLRQVRAVLDRPRRQ